MYFVLYFIPTVFLEKVAQKFALHANVISHKQTKVFDGQKYENSPNLVTPPKTQFNPRK
jgi:hypothetical protein